MVQDQRELKGTPEVDISKYQQGARVRFLISASRKRSVRFPEKEVNIPRRPGWPLGPGRPGLRLRRGSIRATRAIGAMSGCAIKIKILTLLMEKCFDEQDMRDNCGGA